LNGIMKESDLAGNALAFDMAPHDEAYKWNV
jgi:hypothetical protein